jgi:S1-C subfamily serine protease
VDGDVVVSLDGHTIETIDDLQRQLTDQRVGRESALTVIRRTDKLDLRITPTEAPERR